MNKPDEPIQSPGRELAFFDNSFLRASAEAVNILLAEADTATGIRRALSIIGAATDVDRVYIFENHPDPKTGAPLTSQRYEWVRAGITPQIANPALQNCNYLPTFKRWLETFSAGKPINGLIRDFPEPERPVLEPQDIISVLAVPIIINKIVWGFIGFDDCRRERVWTEVETSILSIAAANICYVLLLRRNEAVLARFQAAMDGTGDAIGMADMQGHHFYQNKAFTNLFGYTVEELERAGGPSATFHDQAIHQQVFKTILAGGSWHGELEMRSRSGRIMSILLRGDAIKGNDGKPFAVFGIHTDITERKKAERVIHEGEVRYRRLIESTTDYIYTVTIENGRAVSTYHGPNCIGVTGYSSEEYKTDRDLWFKMVHPDDRQKVLDQAQQVLKGSTTLPREHRIYHKNGSVRWVRNTPVPHFDASGKLISYDGLIADVTERKNAEEQLKEHARQLEIVNRIITAVNRVEDFNPLLTESLKASLEMVSFDGGGIYLLDSDGLTAELISHQGLSEHFISKSPILKISAANNRMLFLEGQPVFTDYDSIMASEQDLKWNIQSVARIPLISKDKVIGALVLINAKRHTFNENEKELLLAIGRQIGTAIAKMRSETALRESERKYRTITEQSLVGIHVIKDDLIIFVNAGWTKITGYGAEEVQRWGAEEYFKIIHPEDRAVFLDQARKKQFGLTEGVLPIYDCRFLSRKGEVKWVSIHSKSVEFAEGRAIVGMIIDITDRKLAAAELLAANTQLTTMNEHLVRREQELVRANSEKEVLLKEIHHRVKNNLQVINSLINLQIHNIADRQAVNLLKDCQSRIKTIATVHEKMYQFGDLAQVDIGSYLESLTRHISHMFLSDPSAVTIRVNAKDIFLTIDQAIPCALLVNELVSNSLKHAFPDHKRGEIIVAMATDASGNYVLMASDNGIGIPPGFDYRNTKSLGMQLVNTFVGQLHGKLDLINAPISSPLSLGDSAAADLPTPAVSAAAEKAGTTVEDKLADSPSRLSFAHRSGLREGGSAMAEHGKAPERAGTTFVITFAPASK